MRAIIPFLVAAFLVGAAPASADSVTLFNEAGSPLGQGRIIVFDGAAGDRIENITPDGGLTVTAQNSATFEGTTLRFTGPRGMLEPGTYPDAHDYDERQADHAGIRVGPPLYDSTPCDR